MSKSHNQSTQAHVQSVAKNLGWTVAKLRWFTVLARAYVKLHGADALLGLNTK